MYARFFYETVAPILSIGNASLVAISTLTSEISELQIISFEYIALSIRILTQFWSTLQISTQD